MDFVLRNRRDLFMELSAIAAMARVLMLTEPRKNKNSKTNVAKKKKRKIAEASKAKNRRRK